MVSEAMLPRAAVREVEQRLTAAGCPGAGSTLRPPRRAGAAAIPLRQLELFRL